MVGGRRGLEMGSDVGIQVNKSIISPHTRVDALP